MSEVIDEKSFFYKGYSIKVIVRSDVPPETKYLWGYRRANFKFGVHVIVEDHIDVWNRGCYSVKDIPKEKRKGIREAKRLIRELHATQS